MKRKILKFLIMIIVVMLAISQTFVYGTSGNLTSKLSYFRYSMSKSEYGWGYALNNSTSHPIYQI